MREWTRVFITYRGMMTSLRQVAPHFSPSPVVCTGTVVSFVHNVLEILMLFTTTIYWLYWATMGMCTASRGSFVADPASDGFGVRDGYKVRLQGQSFLCEFCFYPFSAFLKDFILFVLKESVLKVLSYVADSFWGSWYLNPRGIKISHCSNDNKNWD